MANEKCARYEKPLMYLKALIRLFSIFLSYIVDYEGFVLISASDTDKVLTTFVVLNALDLPGFDGALSFIEQAQSYSYETINCRYVVYLNSKYLNDIANYEIPVRLRSLGLSVDKEIIFYSNPNKLKDSRIGILKPAEEHVSDIIAVWKLSYDSISRRLKERKDLDTSKHVLMLTFMDGNVPLPTPLFSELLDMIQKYDLVLLGMNLLDVAYA
jgi:hypothetical protein